MLHSLPAIATALFAVITLHLVTIFLEMTPIRNGGHWDLFWDCDTYVWLTRALALYQEGNWYTPANSSLSFPDQMMMHWTRPVDVILLAGGWVGSFFTDYKTALEIWARILAPLMHLGTIFIISFAVKPFASNRAFIALVLLFVVQRGIYNQFAAGQVDNHPLLALGLVLLIGLALRHVHQPKRRYLMAIGLTAAMITWVSVEGLVPLLVIILGFGLLWLGEGKDWLKSLSTILWCFALALTLALALDKPPGAWIYQESDRLSSLQVGVAWLLAAITYMCHTIVESCHELIVKSLKRRMSFALLGSLAPIAAVYFVFPAFFQGAHPWINDSVAIMLEQQTDEQPFLPTNPYQAYHFIIDMGPLVLTVLFVATMAMRQQGAVRRRMCLYAAGLLVMTPFTLYLYRGIGYLQIMLIFPWFEALVWCYKWLRQQYRQLDPCQPVLIRSGKRVAMLVAMIMLVSWHWQVAVALNGYYNFNLAKVNDWNQHNKPWCQYSDVIPYITNNGRGDLNYSILTDFWAAPEMMYKTGYSVFYSPYHRNGKGIDDGFMLSYANKNDGIGVRIASQRRLKYIVLCRKFVNYAPDSYIHAIPGGLISRLNRGEAPYWLAPVPLPKPLRQQFIVYKSLL